ncbi:MAG: hypothetical protein VKL39_22065 [Leptolyngbyaceae bacterium]|nr:hypothetical protein [Leptolyngbyaceae bacterium]
MEVSKEEFLDWKQNHVTQAVFAILDQRIQDAKDVLGATAGDDPVADRYLVGMIRGFSELQEITYED